MSGAPQLPWGHLIPGERTSDDQLEPWKKKDAWKQNHAAPTVQRADAPLDFPPGFAGEVTAWLCNSVAQSVREAGIAGALGMLAGINGGAYTVSKPGTGLNLFVLALALSGMGKEAMHRIHHLMHVACDIPDVHLAKARMFVKASKPVSEAALARSLANNPCHVSVQGEFCRTLHEMAEAKTSSPLYGLMTLMTALYEKSGPQSVVGGREYSDPSNNVQEVRGTAYSVLGEGTPGTFYDSLTESMMANGFLSRWTVFECTQVEVPPRNENPVTEPPEQMLTALRWMLIEAVKRQSKPTHVPATDDAQALLDDFRATCVEQLNRAGRDERKRAPLTRAYMKVYRIAGNLAVADYWKEMVAAHSGGASVWPELAVRAEHAAWAIKVEGRNIRALTTRIDSGDAGSDDHTRQQKIIEVVRRYFSKPDDKYELLRVAGLIPRAFIQSNVSRVTAFSLSRNGATRAMDETLRSLVESGYLMDVDKKKLADEFNTTGRCYRLRDLEGGA